MNISPELIAQFLNGQCSKEEAEYVFQYFQERPEELEKYVSEEEWAAFSTSMRIDTHTDKTAWAEIRTHTYAAARGRKIYMMRSVAAAALLLLVTGGTLYMLRHHERPAPAIAAVKNTITAPAYTNIYNNEKKDKKIKLEDGSEILLLPGSKLQYQHPFTDKQRLVKLAGKAFFEIAGDSKRPFIVYAGELTTTVLGTSFWIEARQHVNIRLISGKVVVGKENNNFPPVYLQPGQQLSYVSGSSQPIVSAIPPLKKKDTGSIAPLVQENDQGITFSQAPLKKVFAKLQMLYQVEISYSEQDIRNMTFSGSYTVADKPADILQTIAVINDLKLEKTATGYRITK